MHFAVFVSTACTAASDFLCAAWSTTDLICAKYDLAAHDCGYNFAGELPAIKRCIAGFGAGFRSLKGPALLRIENRYISVAPTSESAAPAGRHSGPQGKSLMPSAPNTPVAISLSITDPVGEGKPSATSGSTFVKVDSKPVLLDGDKIDTCDGLGVPMIVGNAVRQLLAITMASEGPDADMTEVVKPLERWSGVEVK